MYRIRYKKTHTLAYLGPEDLAECVTLGYRWQLKILSCDLPNMRIIWVVNHNDLNRHGYPKIAAELQLTPSGPGTWEVGLVVVDQEFRGEDLACKIYKYLIRQGMQLRAGSAQSPGGRYIWYRLSQSSDIQVLARKKWGRKVFRLRPNHESKEAYHPEFEYFDTDRDAIVTALVA